MNATFVFKLLYSPVTVSRRLNCYIRLERRKKQGGWDMLKLTVKPGDYISIGDSVKVIFSGGSKNNVHLLIDAPKDVNIQRNSAFRKESPYFGEEGISPEAQREIMEIIHREAQRMKER